MKMEEIAGITSRVLCRTSTGTLGEPRAVCPTSGIPTMTQRDEYYLNVLWLSNERPCNTLNCKTLEDIITFWISLPKCTFWSKITKKKKKKDQIDFPCSISQPLSVTLKCFSFLPPPTISFCFLTLGVWIFYVLGFYSLPVIQTLKSQVLIVLPSTLTKQQLNKGRPDCGRLWHAFMEQWGSERQPCSSREDIRCAILTAS